MLSLWFSLWRILCRQCCCKLIWSSLGGCFATADSVFWSYVQSARVLRLGSSSLHFFSCCSLCFCGCCGNPRIIYESCVTENFYLCLMNTVPSHVREKRSIITKNAASTALRATTKTSMHLYETTVDMYLLLTIWLILILMLKRCERKTLFHG